MFLLNSTITYLSEKSKKLENKNMELIKKPKKFVKNEKLKFFKSNKNLSRSKKEVKINLQKLLKKKNIHFKNFTFFINKKCIIENFKTKKHKKRKISVKFKNFITFSKTGQRYMKKFIKIKKSEKNKKIMQFKNFIIFFQKKKYKKFKNLKLKHKFFYKNALVRKIDYNDDYQVALLTWYNSKILWFRRFTWKENRFYKQSKRIIKIRRTFNFLFEFKKYKNFFSINPFKLFFKSLFPKIFENFNFWWYNKVKQDNNISSIFFKKPKYKKNKDFKIFNSFILKNPILLAPVKKFEHRLRKKEWKRKVVKSKKKLKRSPKKAKLYFNAKITKIFKIKKKKINTNLQNKISQIFKVKYRKIYFEKNFQYKLFWEKLHLKFKRRMYQRKKSFERRYLSFIFYPFLKNQFFKYNLKNQSNLLKALFFFKLVRKKIVMRDKKNLFFYVLKRKRKISRFFDIHGQYPKYLKYNRKNIRQFIFQRRKKKEGFNFWKVHDLRWLYINTLKHKTVKFYFNPLRIKPLILKKKLKYLLLYKRFQQKHPRVGQWSTIGLVGNYMGRNTLYVKKKILFFIFSNFYRIVNKNKIKNVNSKKKKIYSRFNNYLTIALRVFEQRLDIVLYRTKLILTLELCRIFIIRGYINVNFITKRNLGTQIKVNDFVAITIQFRNILRELNIERYESFRKIYLNHFYKIPYMNSISKYITMLLANLKHLISKQNWVRTFSQISKFLDLYKAWTPTITTKELKNLRLKVKDNIFKFKSVSLRFQKRIKWKWFHRKNKLLNTRLGKIKQNFFEKKSKTLKTGYKEEVQKIHYIVGKRNSKYKKKISNKKKKNLHFFSYIIKDILNQTWEHFPKNFLINLKFRYIYILQIFNFNFQKNEIYENYGRLDINHINWLLKN